MPRCSSPRRGLGDRLRRTVAHLDDNIVVHELRLTDEDIADPGAVSTPARNFSAGTTEERASWATTDMTIDGRFIPRNWFSPQTDGRFD